MAPLFPSLSGPCCHGKGTLLVGTPCQHCSSVTLRNSQAKLVDTETVVEPNQHTPASACPSQPCGSSLSLPAGSTGTLPLDARFWDHHTFGLPSLILPHSCQGPRENSKGLLSLGVPALTPPPGGGCSPSPEDTYLQGLLIPVHEEGHCGCTATTDAPCRKDQNDRAQVEVNFCRREEGVAWSTALVPVVLGGCQNIGRSGPVAHK